MTYLLIAAIVLLLLLALLIVFAMCVMAKTADEWADEVYAGFPNNLAVGSVESRHATGTLSSEQNGDGNLAPAAEGLAASVCSTQVGRSCRGNPEKCKASQGHVGHYRFGAQRLPSWISDQPDRHSILPSGHQQTHNQKKGTIRISSARLDFITVCSLCWREIDQNNQPIGEPLEPRGNHSHGICWECLPKYARELGWTETELQAFKAKFNRKTT